MHKIAIIMGSQSDWATMRHSTKILDDLDIDYRTMIISAHRTPERLYEFAKNAEKNGFNIWSHRTRRLLLN